MNFLAMATRLLPPLWFKTSGVFKMVGCWILWIKHHCSGWCVFFVSEVLVWGHGLPRRLWRSRIFLHFWLSEKKKKTERELRWATTGNKDMKWYEHIHGFGEGDFYFPLLANHHFGIFFFPGDLSKSKYLGIQSSTYHLGNRHTVSTWKGCVWLRSAPEIVPQQNHCKCNLIQVFGTFYENGHLLETNLFCEGI